MSEQSAIVLLDTHIWIWLLMGNEDRIKPKVRAFIEEAVPSSGIRIAAISVWELGMLEAKGRIHIPLNCQDWVDKALRAPGISLAPMSPEIAIESSRLPGEFHGDPADRLIVATARILDATLVTHDQEIIDYSLKKYVRVFKA